MALNKLTSNDVLKNWRLRINELIDEVDKRSPINHASSEIKYGISTGTEYGHVKLIDDVNAVYDNTSGIAASPLAVKKVYDIAKSAIQLGTKIEGTIEADSFKGTLEGNADTATLATNAINDKNGNNIVETYATKNEIKNGIMYTGSLKRDGTSIQWKDILTDINSSFLYQTSYVGYMPALNLQTQDGRIGFGTYQSLCRWDYFLQTNSTNTPDAYIDLNPSGVIVKGVLTVNGGETLTGDLQVNGHITATETIIGDKVFNAYWNDYAEFFEKGEETEVGDIVALDFSSDEERYVKASKENPTVVGVHSDSYGHILGGKDTIEESEKTHIPVGLVGRVKTKIVGKIKKGEFVVLSGIAGVGCAYDEEVNNPLDVIGVAVETSNDTGIKLVKIKLK